MEEDNTHLKSSHIFMFPFRFDYAEDGVINKEKKEISEFEFYYENDIEDRIDLEKLNEKLTADTSGWEYNKHKDYNSFVYFYDYARDAIFNRSKTFDKNDISATYIRDDYNDKKYIIDIIEKKDGENRIKKSTYPLTIKGLTLQVFQTGVGILSIKLDYVDPQERSEEKKLFDDILRINDYGRRIYPAFIGDKDSEILNKPKEAFLANKITIQKNDNDKKDTIEDFTGMADKDKLDTSIGKHIMKLLGEGIFTDSKIKCDKYYIQPSLDDRMFVMCWYGEGYGDTSNSDAKDDKKTTSTPTAYGNKFNTGQYEYSSDNAWYRYLFVDNGKSPTIANKDMKEELLKEATYKRWISNEKSAIGTIWGITRYSFMVITSTYQNLIDKKMDYIVQHLHSHYFLMSTMLLANRTSILRFSDEISSLISYSENNSHSENATKTEKLYKKYLDYYNRLFFKEVTHQDQGIELYDLGIKQMKIDDHIKKLDGKFTKLFEFNNLRAEQEQQDIDKREQKKKDDFNTMLSFFGTLFILPSIIIGLLSLDILQPNSDMSIWRSIVAPLTLSILPAFTFLLIKKKWAIITSIILLCASIYVIIFFNAPKVQQKIDESIIIKQCKEMIESTHKDKKTIDTANILSVHKTTKKDNVVLDVPKKPTKEETNATTK